MTTSICVTVTLTCPIVIMTLWLIGYLLFYEGLFFLSVSFLVYGFQQEKSQNQHRTVTVVIQEIDGAPKAVCWKKSAGRKDFFAPAVPVTFLLLARLHLNAR